MKAKILVSMLFLFLTTSSSCQVKKQVMVSGIKDNLIDFLISKGDIMEHQIKKFKEGKSKINLYGIHNDYHKDELIDGIYSLSVSISHTRSYFLIVEEEGYTILDISSREELDSSLKKVLDFCERKKYCFDITADYVSRIVGLYYAKNKNPAYGMDINCETGVKDTKDLP